MIKKKLDATWIKSKTKEIQRLSAALKRPPQDRVEQDIMVFDYNRVGSCTTIHEHRHNKKHRSEDTETAEGLSLKTDQSPISRTTT